MRSSRYFLLWVHSISSRSKSKIYSEIVLHSGNFMLRFQRKKITCPLEKDFKSLFDKKVASDIFLDKTYQIS